MADTKDTKYDKLTAYNVHAEWLKGFHVSSAYNRLIKPRLFLGHLRNNMQREMMGS